jgi:hypothetical protein
MQLKAYRDAHIVANYCRKPKICGEKELKHNYLNKKKEEMIHLENKDSFLPLVLDR